MERNLNVPLPYIHLFSLFSPFFLPFLSLFSHSLTLSPYFLTFHLSYISHTPFFPLNFILLPFPSLLPYFSPFPSPFPSFLPLFSHISPSPFYSFPYIPLLLYFSLFILPLYPLPLTQFPSSSLPFLSLTPSILQFSLPQFS